MKKILILLSVFFLSPIPLLAQVMMVEMLPNTTDDAALEYVDITNTGCESVDIGGYILSDKMKSYIFPSPSVIESHMTYRVGRPVSRIELNNSNEELTLRDSVGEIIHSFSYATSMKGDPVVLPGVTYDVCDVRPPNDMGMTDDTDTMDTDIPEDETPENAISSTDEESDVPIGTGGTDEGLHEDNAVNIPDEQADNILTQDDTSENPVSDEGIDNGTDMEDIVSTGAESTETLGDEIVQLSGFLGKTGSLLPEVLLYDDTDNDGHIDTLEILYDVALTGSIDIDRITLYSNTGGLYTERINTATGYILGYELEDNMLRLMIHPSDYDGSTLEIDNTTQSDLRLKYTNTGLTSYSGEVLGDFFLTTSFDSYRTVYSRAEYDMLSSPVDEEEVVESPVVVSFPDIVPTIQNYTNTTLSGETFVCREVPCRINLNFESIFNSTYPASDYTCQVRYAGSTENKCNPTQWNPTGPGDIEFILTHKSSGQSLTKRFPILWNIISSGTSSNITSYTVRPTPPRASIELNGYLTRSQVQSGSTIHCLSGTCSVNLDGSSSSLTQNVGYKYLWTSSGRILSERKNPAEFQFAPGNHTIEFIITDEYGQSSVMTYQIMVEDTIQETNMDIVLAGTVDTGSRKKPKMEFFSPPSLILDNPSASITVVDSGYRCVSTAKTCSLNFSLGDTMRGVDYQWKYSHEGTEYITDNPRSKAFSPGRYTLTLTASYTDTSTPIWTGTYLIESVQYKKSKPQKSAQKSTKTQNNSIKQGDSSAEKKTIELIPSAYAGDMEDEGSRDMSILFILFISVMLNIFFIRRKS